MRILLDTNVIIDLEPTAHEHLSPLTMSAAELVRIALQHGVTIYQHPKVRQDLARDKDTARFQKRSILLNKYAVLPDPPGLWPSMTDRIGKSAEGTNDFVDDHYLAAVFANAVDLLVTEDKGIHRKAALLDLHERVLRIDDALAAIRKFFPVPAPSEPPPLAERTVAHSLDPHDPIVTSFREDYAPHFDKWLEKCQRQHRLTWVIRVPGSSYVKAFCIVKEENPNEHGLPLTGRVLKICSFKVSDEYLGFRFGELLLKCVFDHAHSAGLDWLFVTIFEKHAGLVALFEDFGFQQQPERTGLGEIVLTKPLTPGPDDYSILDPWTLHFRFGPHAANLSEVPFFLVPIQPQYSEILFPETRRQTNLLEEASPFGNAIRKAYLSASPIRRLNKADILLFYVSENYQVLLAAGIVEQILVSDDAEEIARATARRTVFSFDEIQEYCQHGQRKVLAILFRQIRILEPGIRGADLLAHGAMSAVPQSIQSVPEEAKPWLIDPPDEVVLLPVRPAFASQIMDGTKRVEFRRRPFRRLVQTIALYVSSPVQRIVALLDVRSVRTDTPQNLWRDYSRQGGIGKDDFDRYFGGLETGAVIEIDNVRPLRSPMRIRDLDPNMRAPQNWAYLGPAEISKLRHSLTSLPD